MSRQRTFSHSVVYVDLETLHMISGVSWEVARSIIFSAQSCEKIWSEQALTYSEDLPSPMASAISQAEVKPRRRKEEWAISIRCSRKCGSTQPGSWSSVT